MKNYLKVENKIPFRSSFLFIDSKDYVSQEIFYNHDFYNIKFSKTEFHKRNSEFVIVKCSIFSKDIKLFEECMEHLNRKLAFLDYDMEEYNTISLLFTVIEELHNE